MIVDTHCHLDDESFKPDLNEVLSRARSAGIEKIVIPGADMADLERAVEISHSNDDVYFAVGVHPYHCHDFDLSYLEGFIRDPKCVGVGECGLDYYRMKENFAQIEIQAEKELQKSVFLAQIDLAKRYEKPLIVHIRDANQDSYDILKAHAEGLCAVLHCFNASELLLSLKDCGFYFGIGGVLTFKNAKNLVEILPKIPLERILIETDAPYLAPTPNRGKRNEPSFTTFVVEKMSELLNLDVKEIESETTKNAKKFFNF